MGGCHDVKKQTQSFVHSRVQLEGIVPEKWQRGFERMWVGSQGEVSLWGLSNGNGHGELERILGGINGCFHRSCFEMPFHITPTQCF